MMVSTRLIIKIIVSSNDKVVHGAKRSNDVRVWMHVDVGGEGDGGALGQTWGYTHRDREMVGLKDRTTRTSLVVTYQSPD